MLIKFYIHEQLYIFKEQVSVAASVRMNKLDETVQVKNENHLRQQLTACACVWRQKEL